MQVAPFPQMNANELIEPGGGGSTVPSGGLQARRGPGTGDARFLRPRALVVHEPAELEGPAARARDLARSVARRIRSRPVSSLLLAVGVGFIVGGALSFRVGRVLLASASRHIARELLKQVL